MALHNYHTHTQRCNHAEGCEREYVEHAIACGMQTLGFSDHAPYLFTDGYYSVFRMQVDELEDYAETVRALAKEYAKDIRILCGFELEYYPDFHKDTMNFLKKISPDYLILGQHFLGNEQDGIITSHTTGDMALTAYVTQVLAGIATGDFLYIAHPDTAGLQCSEEVLQREFRRLCQGAKRFGIPLEINLLGLRRHRHYPRRSFFEIAAEVGNDVVLGADAHTPQDVFDPASEEIARSWIKDLGLHLIEQIL